jgi:[glutamine synthetase] adenylyltransferase / [glutamine synthetase]-adenylyl-L-tyrosine phosphorylase
MASFVTPDADVLRDVLEEETSEASIRRLLEPVGFGNLRLARERLVRLAADEAGKELLAAVLPALLLNLSDTAQPDHALLNFERFGQTVPDRHKFLAFLRDHPRAVEILVRLFVGSQFLTEILLCNPEYLERLTQHKRLADLKSVQQLHIEAQGVLMGLRERDEQLNALRRFQRWELLRIGVCDFFGLLDLRRVTVQLSLLADALVQSCLGQACADTEVSSDGLAIIAMGKLGGEELNYSSDIDLLFVASGGSGMHWRVGQRLIKALTDVSDVGFMYRVDMRLRPWGRAGELVSSLDTHLSYMANNARLWEKQAHLKARVIAGDRALGAEFLRRVEPLIYNSPPEAVRESVRLMKQKIEADLERTGRLDREVKLGQGSIRDVEFVVQYLQLIHGAKEPAVRSFKTLDALVRLADCGFLHADEYRLLTDGYVFLRNVEHALQLMHNKQVHELPREEAELSYLARRLDFPTGAQFLAHYRQHGEAIRNVYNRYLGDRDKARQPDASPRTPSLKKHLARLEASYVDTFSEDEMARHAALAEQIDDHNPIVVEAVPGDDGSSRVTIVGFDYLGELSLICGLMLAHGFNVVDGQVFTYEPLSEPAPKAGAIRRAPVRGRGARRPARTIEGAAAGQKKEDVRRKIVDVFTVRRASGPATAELWTRYTDDLKALQRQLQAGNIAEAQGELVKRVAASLRGVSAEGSGMLYPVEIEIDNDTSDQFTVLRISTRDTIGFLYELTNALALNGVYIARMHVATAGDQAADVLWVTDDRGQKIVDPQKQREMQAATVLIKHFTHLLPSSPNPESALLHFREFVAQLFAHPDWANEIASLEQTDVLDALARLLGVSDFLWNDFLRMQHANLFPVVRDVEALAQPRTRSELAADLQRRLAAARDAAARREELNAFKDREMFRVDMRHILGHIGEFPEFSEELTTVAEVVVESAVQICLNELLATYGLPALAEGGPCPYVVAALGKCGGRELGFASDIELMFIYAGEGTTAGPEQTSATQFYIKLVEGVTHAIRARREGIFEIDLRLRPYGRGGSLAVSLDAFRSYFGPEGAAWPYERQALVKLRPIAGDAGFGREIARLRDELIYTGEPFDIGAMRGMRERQIRQLVIPGAFNAKLSPGGLVDVEYLVQGLQITHGARNPELRTTNTLEAIDALARAGLLSAEDRARLRGAYNFLRELIGALRIVRGNAKDLTLPGENSEEFAFLARRLGYGDDASRLKSDVSRHTAAVQESSTALLG